MRALPAGMLLAPLALAACGKPDFDTRYAEQEQKLEGQAKAIGQELDRRMTEKPGLDQVKPLEGTPEPS